VDRSVAKAVDQEAMVESEIPRPSSRETASPPHLGERPRERLAGNRLCERTPQGIAHAERAEAGPGREQLAGSIGSRPEVGTQNGIRVVLARPSPREERVLRSATRRTQRARAALEVR